jgi:RNA recognition motif-containing protein
MSSADEANRAIEIWNGKELGGRTLLVSLARPQERNDRFSR